MGQSKESKVYLKFFTFSEVPLFIQMSKDLDQDLQFLKE